MNYIRLIILSVVFTSSYNCATAQKWFKFLKENPQYKEVVYMELVHRPILLPFQSVQPYEEIKKSYHYEKASNSFLEKDYCCVRQVKHFLYSYDHDDKITEVLLYRVHETPKRGISNDFVDTVWVSREFYSYDKRDRLIEKKKINYVKKSRVLETSVRSIATYSYNWRSKLNIETYQFMLLKPPYRKYYSKHYYNWKGQLKKKEEFVGESKYIADAAPESIITYEYDPATNNKISEIEEKHDKEPLLRQYFYTGDYQTKRVIERQESTSTYKYRYEKDLLVASEYLIKREGKETFKRMIYKYVLAE